MQVPGDLAFLQAITTLPLRQDLHLCIVRVVAYLAILEESVRVEAYRQTP